MKLTRPEILLALKQGKMEIKPFVKKNLGTNSLDVRLSKNLLRIKDHVLDPKKAYECESIVIPKSGYLLHPDQLYLGVTVEWTYTPYHVPCIDGRSTMGRYFLTVHQSAGFGDCGFAAHWVLEITCIKPTYVYPNMRIGQISFDPISEWASKHLKDSYQKTGHYNANFSRNPYPIPAKPGNF